MRVQWVNSKGSPAVLWFSTKMDGFKHLMRHSERLQKNTKAVLECLKMPQGHL